MAYFADTNSTVTKVYIDYYLKENISQEEFDLLDRLYQVTQAREKWDLIFVILPKSNYVDDGSRDMTMLITEHGIGLPNISWTYYHHSRIKSLF